MNYSNTNEHLYDDIALWEKTDGRDLFLEMPLTERTHPQFLISVMALAKIFLLLVMPIQMEKSMELIAALPARKRLAIKLRRGA